MIINDRELDRILATVQKPARYIGGEFNSIVKDWDTIPTKIALAFPEVYDLGMSNLGLAILYNLVNQQPHLLAERVFVPWVDMARAMRAHRMPLYSLETRHTVRDFDLIGISLPYEQLFSNVLNLLDLAQMPLHSIEREASFPLVLAGGNAVFNPEPMSDFIDIFVIGEGEDVLLEIIAAFEDVRHANRDTQLRRMAQIPGVYVPRFYRPVYHPADGTLMELLPTVDSVPARITKRISPLMPQPVTKFILPHTDVVFSRASVEIQRGCTRGCRFCHAGMVFRPVRERSLAELLETVDAIVRDTGHEELGLLSLSSSDYSQIGPLVQAISEKYQGAALNISLPSLRLESFSAELAEMLIGRRKSGFTFAPEAATDRLRNVINKPISTDALLDAVDAVYQRGWQMVKLYFMIGQPTETDEDVIAIGTLAKQVLAIGRRYHNNKAKVRIGVSTFVPKPHTPFQWAALWDVADIERKQRILLDEIRGQRSILYNYNNPEESLLEAALSRGDRRLGAVIERAWELGAGFDAWTDQFRGKAWWQAFDDVGLSAAWYAQRPRLADEVFPWDHIDAGVEKRWLLLDWQSAQQGETKIDCREHCYNCGILSAFKGLRAATPPTAWKCPPVRNPRWQKKVEGGDVIGLTPVVKESMARARVPEI